jgi:hypothetical protein
MNKIMCIEYLGTLGSTVRVPALKGSRTLDVETGAVAPGGAAEIAAGECRLVDEALGQQLVDQGSYRARTFLLAVDGGVADGKSKLQVLVCARHADGRPKAEASISLGAPGSARISDAKLLEPGLFVAILTAPREAGPVTVHGKVDGERVALLIDFPPSAAPEAVEDPPVVPSQD